ncbi:MAG TPA: hypothetical protein VJM12_23125 [Pyrinomonadaceae bacterium]|nr:hypothetical protein [Pyrinomonadaceae bacterium]
MTLILAFTLFIAAPQWTIQTSGTNSRLRGISAVTDRIAWASGSDSTVLRTLDGGATWRRLTVTNDKLDFRDIDAFDARTAYLLSIGNGPASRIYKTTDGGATWTLQFKNDDPKAFYDAMSFWDRNHGIVIGDSIDGKFCIMTTENGGRNWNRVPDNVLPRALENEGAFAASGTNIAIFGKSHAWIATGGARKGRVLRTTDRGRTWTIAETPFQAGSSAGIFSIAFRSATDGVIVGGDYTKETEAVDNLAVTTDGGGTWSLVKGLSGYRSVVAYVPGTRSLVAIGPSGVDYSTDDGRTWQQSDIGSQYRPAVAGGSPNQSAIRNSKSEIPGKTEIPQGFDTLSFARRRVRAAAVGWAAGARGNIAMIKF